MNMRILLAPCMALMSLCLPATGSTGDCPSGDCAAIELAQARKPKPAPAQECPAGTHPWVDSQGKPTCEPMPGTATESDAAEACPKGSVVVMDSNGKKRCRML